MTPAAALTASEATPQSSQHAVNPWIIAVSVSLATFMELLDTTVANVALPHIAGGLAASEDETTWVLTSYLVANAIGLPLSGWFSTVLGRKRYYLGCVLMFTLTSALCGAAPSLNWLVFFRVIQGLAGGGLQPCTQAVLMDTFPAARLGMAMSVYGVAILVAPVVGPVLGGWLTDNFSWRWIFFLNVPIGALALALNGVLLKDPPYLVAQRKALRGTLRIDYLGIGFLALGFGSLEVVYSRGQRDDWFGSNFIVSFMVLAAIGLIGLVLWELYTPQPVVNLRLLKDLNFTACSVITFLAFATLYGSLMLLPQMVQTLMGYDATHAGLVLSPGGLVTIALLPVVGWLTGRVDARILIALSLAALAYAYTVASGMNLQCSELYFIYVRCLIMVGIALIWPPINATAFAHVPQAQHNNASGLYNLIRNEGGSLGISLSTTLLARWGQLAQSRLNENVHALNPHVPRALDQFAELAQADGADPIAAQHEALGMMQALIEQQAAVVTYGNIYALFAVCSLAIIPLVLLMRPARAGRVAVAE